MKELEASLDRSREAAEALLADIAEADVAGLMEAKRKYVGAILEAIPVGAIGSREVDRRIGDVASRLEEYW